MRYRKDVQMLRGIAVLLVVLFHLRISGFESGFLGVDVFFVISGYLMAVMYEPGAKADFFAKRAQRLLPAYFATVLATLITALLITTPNDFAQVAMQAHFAAFFASNIGFWSENSYFSKAAFKPLLHLWSLGVEIQFYLFVPALYWVLHRMGRVGYVIIGAGSAAACFWVVGVSPKTSFFWMPFRLWEFLLGFGVARFLARRSLNSRPELAWVGLLSLLVILLIPIFPVNGEATNFLRGHPGMSAAAISAATAAVMLLRLPAVVQGSRTATALERLGDYSYSIYLAHFPVIVLMLYRPFAGTVLEAESATQLLITALLVAAISALLFRFVEAPTRRGALRAWRLTLAGAAAIGLATVGTSLQSLQMPESERAIYAAWEDRSTYRCGKVRRLLSPREISCEITPPGPRRGAILLVGNSHADSIKTTFAQAAAAQGVAVYFMVGNDPLLAGGISPQILIAEATSRKADAIVLHYSPGSLDASVVRAVAQLANEVGIRVSFVMPIPVWDRHVPQMLWAAAKHGRPLEVRTLEDYERTNARLSRGLSAITVPNFKVYAVAQVFCSSACALTSSAGRPYYFDSGHLTLTGSESLREVFSTAVHEAISAGEGRHARP